MFRGLPAASAKTVRNTDHYLARVGQLILVAVIMLIPLALLPNVIEARGLENVCGLPCAHAQLSVATFSQDTVSWSLTAVVDGNVRFSGLLAEIIGGKEYYPQFRYNSFYDSSRNSTTFYDSFQTNFTRIYSLYPTEVWYFHFYFAMINASVQNAYGGPVVNQTMPLPTLNYQGLYNIQPLTSAAMNPFNQTSTPGPKVPNSGFVYSVRAYIFRPDDSVATLKGLGTIAGLLFVAFWVMLSIIPFRVGVILWRRRPQHRIDQGVGSTRLLSHSYFTIVATILFFLPIYFLALRPLVAPLSFVPGDLQLYWLVGGYGSLLITAFVADTIVESLSAPHGNHRMGPLPDEATPSESSVTENSPLLPRRPPSLSRELMERMIQRIDESFEHPGRRLRLAQFFLLYPLVALLIVIITPTILISLFVRYGITEAYAIVAVMLAFASYAFVYLRDFYQGDESRAVERYHLRELQNGFDPEDRILLRALIRLRRESGVRLDDLYRLDRSLFRRVALARILAGEPSLA